MQSFFGTAHLVEIDNFSSRFVTLKMFRDCEQCRAMAHSQVCLEVEGEAGFTGARVVMQIRRRQSRAAERSQSQVEFSMECCW